MSTKLLKFKSVRRVVSYDALGRPAAVTVADGRTVRTAYDRFGRINSPGRRVSEFYLNEPHPTGGNPVAMWTDNADNPAGREMSVAAATRLLFNDMLGSTLAYLDGGEMTETGMTLFDETEKEAQEKQIFFTGKPRIDELGYAFLFRNYRPEKSKWQTADPLGYPDGWNCMAYCGNGASGNIDIYGLYVEEFELNLPWVPHNKSGRFSVEFSDNSAEIPDISNAKLLENFDELSFDASDIFFKLGISINGIPIVSITSTSCQLLSSAPSRWVEYSADQSQYRNWVQVEFRQVYEISLINKSVYTMQVGSKLLSHHGKWITKGEQAE